MSKVSELNKLALKLTGENPYKKTIKESLDVIATFLAGEEIDSENIEDAIQKCTEYYSGGGGGSRDWTEIGFEAEPKSIQEGFDYAKQIMEDWDSSITSMYNKYKGNKKLTYFPLVDTSNVDSAVSAFNNCSSLEEIALINTSKVKDMGSMFYSCYALKSVPSFDMSAVTNASSMFTNCAALSEINLDFTNLFSKTSNAGGMFEACSSLTTINFGNLDNIDRTSNLGTFSDMFTGCNNLDDDTLNRIMKLLPKLRPTSPGNLKGFGISSAQATRCQSLSNYADFIAAGWTTGY